MILGINGIRLQGHRTGVGRSIEAILEHFDRFEHPFTDIRVYSQIPIGRDIVLPKNARNVVLPSRLPPALWEQWTLPRAHGQSGVLLCPSYVAPVFARSPVLVAHHGSYEGYPAAFSRYRLLKAWFAYALSAQRADVVTAISECSRQDIIRFYRVRPEKIHLVSSGVDTSLFKPSSDPDARAAWRRNRIGADVPFILYAGKATPRRNIPSLIEAFARLKKERGRPHRLVLVGPTLDAAPWQSRIDELGIRGDTVVLNFVPAQELPLVFSAADMLVYPSSYEGFGLPVLEAMACGTPAIALNNTAFPEFADGVALLLPDARVDTLLDGIDSIITDPGLRAQMAAAGPPRAARYDWRVVVGHYVTLLNDLAARGRNR